MNAKRSRKKSPQDGNNLPQDGKDLLKGEKIPFGYIDSQRKATDAELNTRYVKGEVRIVTESARYSLAGILGMLQEEVDAGDGTESELRYKLDPEYQRRHRWDNKRKSRLIESFLMNVPVPPVFLYERELARWEVMDGRQRLTALSEFYSNTLRLEGLEYWPELDGRTYAELPTRVRDGIDRRYISSIILLKETASSEEQAARLKKMVFERLNSGGVALSHQESRNAVYSGPLNDLCLDLSKNEYFKSMWGLPDDPIPDEESEDEFDEQDDSTKAGKRMFEKMEDVELILRFFAYRQIDSFPGGLNKISALLDRFLIAGNKFSSDLLDDYRAMFEQTISLLWEILGVHAFHRLDADGNRQSRSKPNKIIYDPLMYVASRYRQGSDRNELMSGKDVLAKELGAMYTEQERLFAGRSTNKADIRPRNDHLERAFNTALEKLRA